MSEGPEFFSGTPEEMMKKIQEVHEHSHALLNDFQHKMEEIWQALSADQLDSLAKWLSFVSSQPHVNMVSQLSYTAGALFRLSSVNADTCMVCDKNHEEAMRMELLTQTSPPVKIDETPQKDPDNVIGPDEIAEIELRWQEDLVEYNLIQDFTKGGFKCSKCGKPYPSVEDRKLKPAGVEGCDGCIEKAKWG